MQNRCLLVRNYFSENSKVKIISSIRGFLAGLFIFIIIASLVTLFIFLIGIVK